MSVVLSPNPDAAMSRQSPAYPVSVTLHQLNPFSGALRGLDTPAHPPDDDSPPTFELADEDADLIDALADLRETELLDVGPFAAHTLPEPLAKHYLKAETDLSPREYADARIGLISFGRVGIKAWWLPSGMAAMIEERVGLTYTYLLVHADRTPENQLALIVWCMSRYNECSEELAWSQRAVELERSTRNAQAATVPTSTGDAA